MKRDQQFLNFSFHPLDNSQWIVWQKNPATDPFAKKNHETVGKYQIENDATCEFKELFVFVKTIEKWNATNLQERILQFDSF
jgi:hypothetical protein